MNRLRRVTAVRCVRDAATVVRMDDERWPSAGLTLAIVQDNSAARISSTSPFSSAVFVASCASIRCRTSPSTFALATRTMFHAPAWSFGSARNRICTAPTASMAARRASAAGDVLLSAEPRSSVRTCSPGRMIER
jgi:hypothetical protein